MRQADDRAIRGRFEREVCIARGYQDQVRLRFHAILGDDSRTACDSAELARENADEWHWQMLRDENRHTDFARQSMKQCAERVDTAGRSAYRQDIDRIAGHWPKSDRRSGLQW